MSATRPDLYGLLGYPLGHTLSPAMHQAALAWAGLPGSYMALPVPPDRLEGAMAGVRAWRLPGLNVTVPHKTAVIPFLDGLTPQAEALGAVNTLFWDGDRLLGDNTDYAGFLESLPPELPADVTVTILGAGGAARAVAAAMRDRGASAIHLAARNLEQAASLRADLLAATPGEILRPDDPALGARFAQSGMLINATPVGMNGHSLPPGAEQLALLPASAWVYDLIYNPAEPPLLATARARGLRCQNGLDMLLCQAAAAFERWTGRKPPLSLLREAVG
ncbi:MAG: shikimate dehydrogenase [Candidatus Sericytochromatia bacterium]